MQLKKYFGDKTKKPFNDYAKLFNFRYGFYCPSILGDGNYILSKFPIKASCLKLKDRTGLKSELKINKQKLFVDVIRPSPFIKDEDKFKAIKPLLETLKIPYILTGDFNSLSDEDKDDGKYYDKSIMLEVLKRIVKEPEKSLEILFERKLIPKIRNYGLKDAFLVENRKWTIPTSRYKKEHSKGGLRLDYFFISDEIKVIETKILVNKYTEIASDHYPIVMIFEI